MTDDLAYFRGWKDASYDLASLLDNLGREMPVMKDIATMVRSKGDHALAYAESMREIKQ